MQIKTKLTFEYFWSGEGNLSYFIGNPETREAILIDPDLEIVGTYFLKMDKDNWRLRAVIDTHNHAEHATAAPLLSRETGAIYVMHELAPSSFVMDRVRDGDERTFADATLRFIHLPGHTPELMAIAWENKLFTGDSLFNRSCGRADLPGGDPGRQFDALQRIKSSFPPETEIWPGHDYNQQTHTTLAEALRENPRLQFTERKAFIRFMDEYYADNEKPDDLEYYVAFNAR